jgi:hypothetical protein
LARGLPVNASSRRRLEAAVLAILLSRGRVYAVTLVDRSPLTRRVRSSPSPLALDVALRIAGLAPPRGAPIKLARGSLFRFIGSRVVRRCPGLRSP